MCHVPLSDPQFFRFLIHIDEALAAEAQAAGCPCGGVLHRADYPRKPRGCPASVRADYSTRLSFCCSQCRRRTTSQSVRFLGRRIWLSWVVVLGSTRPAGPNTAVARLSEALAIPWRTVARWRRWWREDWKVAHRSGDCDLLNSDELGFQLRLAVLQQHGDDFLKVAL